MTGLRELRKKSIAPVYRGCRVRVPDGNGSITQSDGYHRVKPTLDATLEAYTNDALSDNANDVIQLAELIPTLKRLHDISTTAFVSRFAEDVRQGHHTTVRQTAVTVFSFKINFELVD